MRSRGVFARRATACCTRCPSRCTALTRKGTRTFTPIAPPSPLGNSRRMPLRICLPSTCASILSVTFSAPSLSMRMLLWKSRIFSTANTGSDIAIAIKKTMFRKKRVPPPARRGETRALPRSRTASSRPARGRSRGALRAAARHVAEALGEQALVSPGEDNKEAQCSRWARSSFAHPVPARSLRTVKRLVGRLHDVVRRGRAFGRPGGADRHRDRQHLLGRQGAAALAALLGLLRAVLAADRHPVALDRAAQRLELRQRLAEVAGGKDHAELLAAVAVGDAAAAHLRQARADELEHLVADIVTVGVVELLEVVDVDHGDGVALAEAAQALLERAPAGQPGERVAEGELMRFLQQRGDQDDAGRGHERGVDARRAGVFGGAEEGSER